MTSAAADQITMKRIDTLGDILDTVWIVICTTMVILAQVGFLMKETGSIKMK